MVIHECELAIQPNTAHPVFLSVHQVGRGGGGGEGGGGGGGGTRGGGGGYDTYYT